MIVALIIVSVILLLSILLNLFLLIMVHNAVNTLVDIDKVEEELAFLSGEIDIPEEDIAAKFPNAIVLCHLEKNISSEDTTKIVDISNYEKNHIIGLTYLVQPQLFDDLKSAVNADAIKERVFRRLCEEYDINPNDTDNEFIEQLLEQAMAEVINEEYSIDEEHGTMTRPLVPHCTVYQLKDGRWLWRQEL